MPGFMRKHGAYLSGAVLLHVLFAGVFGLTMVRMSRNAPPPQLAIQAVVVDQSLLSRAHRQPQRDRERAQQHEREQAAAQQRRERQEVARGEAEQRAEQERQVEQQQREEAEQRRKLEEQTLRERQAAEHRQAEAEREQQAAAERKRKEAEQRRRAAEEARAQQTREAELRRQLEEEEGRAQAANSGLLNQYVALIEQRIVRNWNRPPSARPGLECAVRVAQTSGGTVLSVQLGHCNGDAAVRQSIEAAVMRSSPLPPPPDPRLFERNLVLVFKPLE